MNNEMKKINFNFKWVSKLAPIAEFLIKYGAKVTALVNWLITMIQYAQNTFPFDLDGNIKTLPTVEKAIFPTEPKEI